MTPRAVRPLVEVIERGEPERRLHVRKAFSVGVGQRIERPDLLPQVHVRVGADQG